MKFIQLINIRMPHVFLHLNARRLPLQEILISMEKVILGVYIPKDNKGIVKITYLLS